MSRFARRFSGLFPVLFIALSFATASLSAASPQEKHASQVAGVDNTKMGAYRALAQVIYHDFQKGDLATAATLARVLERLWDKAEDYGGDAALSKTNHALFDEIDKAMDQFVSPLIESKTKAPDPAKVKTAFAVFLEKLSLAD